MDLGLDGTLLTGMAISAIIKDNSSLARMAVGKQPNNGEMGDMTGRSSLEGRRFMSFLRLVGFKICKGGGARRRRLGSTGANGDGERGLGDAGGVRRGTGPGIGMGGRGLFL